MTRNRLADETSPYLLQHKDNPVHWWAWGPEALAEAKHAGKPILLSVGYAACHWCHVMAHESFEDEATAKVMNDLYVCIKVDREERPDIDAIYMGALQRLGEHGGWPLTMFLDADARPFWGGTYFPPETRWGKPAFRHVLTEVARIFHEDRDKVRNNADALTDALAGARAAGPGLAITDELLADVVQHMARAIDPIHGGIRGAPKFPQWSFFWLLWRGAIRYRLPDARRAVVETLRHVCQGGIYDHLAGGFARYSTDERWLVPHFEKMLYDNALLLDLMTEVWRETHDPLFALRIEETARWLLAEMQTERGAFAASLDADSEGEEGRFYVWSANEIEEALGAEDARLFASVYDVSEAGNWEGKNVLNRLARLELGPDEDERRLASLRASLSARRAERQRPAWDDKVLADWNGLAIAALAAASQVFDRLDWLAAAERAFAFVENEMTVSGRLRHAARAGRAEAPATASDYANMIRAAIKLHQATGARRYRESAAAWTRVLDRHYWLDGLGGYAQSADDTRDVIVRLAAGHDDATPNANGIMMTNLVWLSLLTGEDRYRVRAEATLIAFSADIRANLAGHTSLLSAAIDLLAPQQVVIVGAALSGGSELVSTLRGLSMPGALEYVIDDATCDGLGPSLEGKAAIGDRATAYACLGPECSLPVTDAGQLASELRRLRIRPSHSE